MFKFYWTTFSTSISLKFLTTSLLRISQSLLLMVSGLLCAQEKFFSAEKPSAAEDLRYGVALYNYYEGDYMSALSELLVAETKGGIKNHGDNPKIMEGGLSLAYGLERHASDIFDDLLERNRPQEVKDAAWYYLSKIRYRNNDWEMAQAAIDKVGGDPEPWLREEIDALRVNIMIREDRLEDAGRFLTDNPLNDAWQPYINYNMASAWSRRENFNNAIRYYNLLASEYFETHEHRGLFDKAMTAAGYLYLFEEEYRLAMGRFSKVRLNSALSNRALLGLGWAASELGEYQEALRPWKHLADSSLIDENTQEALLAVPFAYERLEANSLALENYKRAERRYLLEIEKLDEIIENVHGEALLEILDIQESKGIDWIDYAQKKQLSPRVAYLSELFSQDEFQKIVQDIRDLLAIKTLMDTWADKLDFYDEMLLERIVSREQKAEFLRTSDIENRIKKMSILRSKYADQLEADISARDYFALSTEHEKKINKHIQSLENNVRLLAKSEDANIVEHEESLRRFKGLQLWLVSDDFEDRVWKEKKKIKALDNVINEMDANYQKALTAMAGTPDIEGHKQRVSSSRERIALQQNAIDEKIANQQLELSEQLVSVLTLQRERLYDYMAQSRLAIARIYDKTSNGEAR